MIICITGTPGTGKSYLAKKLSKKTGFRYLDLNSFIKENKLYDSYDKSLKTYDVDTTKVAKFLNMLLKKFQFNKEDKFQEQLKHSLDKHIGKKFSVSQLLKSISSKKPRHNKINNIIIDSHLSHFIKSDYCFVVKSDIKTLSKRLSKRKYSKKKIEDNLQSEIFDICLEDAIKERQKIIIINN